MNLFNHTYYQLNKPFESLLEFKWHTEHQEMSYEDFKEACSNYAGYAGEHEADKLLVDTRNFKLNLPEDFPQWQREIHNPRLFRLGVKKMAYLMPESSLAFVKDVPASKIHFATRYFAQEKEALEWLNADN